LTSTVHLTPKPFAETDREIEQFLDKYGYDDHHEEQTAQKYILRFLSPSPSLSLYGVGRFFLCARYPFRIQV
jgi:hypothetical protein